MAASAYPVEPALRASAAPYKSPAFRRLSASLGRAALRLRVGSRVEWVYRAALRVVALAESALPVWDFPVPAAWSVLASAPPRVASLRAASWALPAALEVCLESRSRACCKAR